MSFYLAFYVLVSQQMNCQDFRLFSYITLRVTVSCLELFLVFISFGLSQGKASCNRVALDSQCWWHFYRIVAGKKNPLHYNGIFNVHLAVAHETLVFHVI